MAHKNSLTRTFIPKQKSIGYLNKTAAQFKQSLLDFAKRYYPDTYNDFSDASSGQMFIDMVSAMGDVLSYYTDANYRENLIQYAQEQDNIISIAQSLGYKPKPSTASIVNLDVYQLCPALDFTSNYEPDPKYMLRIQPNMVVSAPQYAASFRTTDVLDFADPTNREITVYAVDGLNRPQTYLIKKTIRIVAGTITTYTTTFGSAKRFSTVTLPDTNVLEIVSVVDADGNTWYEVDYLAQDLVLNNIINTRPASQNEGVSPFYTIDIVRTPMRFVTRYDSNFFLELHFGSGVIDDTDSRINLEPNKIFNDEYQLNLASTPLDPSDFLSSNSYGLAPSNTSMTITYTTGGGLQSNVPSKSITKIAQVALFNDLTIYSPSEQQLFQVVVNSLSVRNEVPATGGKGSDSIEEIRQNALAFFNAQNRLVTADDYVVRCYAMPPKYGGIAKAVVIRDEQIGEIQKNNQASVPPNGIYVNDRAIPNIVNLYVLGYDMNKKLTILNADTKQNLATYLNNYRILTDHINILDGFIINIGVNFQIVVYKSYNANEVLARAIDAVTQFFNIDNWQFQQPIILGDLQLAIANVDGVQTVTNVTITNLNQSNTGNLAYQPYAYDIDSATENGIIYTSMDASLFQVLNPSKDIVGTVTQ